MGNLGFGVMIGMLAGNDDSVAALQASLGKKITALSLGKDDALHFAFEDGSRIKLSDEGQSCCENRYMTTDDDLKSFVGATFDGAELREAPSQEDEYGECHDVEFLRINTSLGTFTMASHNEHNGYYGGFCVRAAKE